MPRSAAALTLVVTVALMLSCDDEQPKTSEPARPSPSCTGDGCSDIVLSTRDGARCEAPLVRPTYLPWTRDVPRPAESYDKDLDRYRQSWRDPRFPPGEAGVGLTIYPLPDDVTGGVPTNIFVQGAKGRLHRGEGGSVTVVWSLHQRCNFLELTMSNPELGQSALERELLRTARSLEREPIYRPPEFRPLTGWFSSGEVAEEGGSPAAWASTISFGDHFHHDELPNLGPEDIALHAQLVTPSDYRNYPLSSFPERDLPLKLEDAKTHRQFLGQWDEDIPARFLTAHTQGHRLMVWIWFGTADPTKEMLQQAQAQLERLKLPPGWEP